MDYLIALVNLPLRRERLAAFVGTDWYDTASEAYLQLDKSNTMWLITLTSRALHLSIHSWQ